MKNLLTIVVVFISFQLVEAQNGVQFETGSWSEIKAKAKAQHKYIFVDCFTTWCAPCKKMNKEVYTDSVVGTYMTNRFISTFLQMDSTDFDNDAVKRTYWLASDFQLKYSIFAYPSYLIFSSDGKVLHRGLGYKNELELIRFLDESLDSNRQYYTRAEKFKSGNLAIDDLQLLLSQASKFGDISLVQQIGAAYKKEYLTKISDEELLNSKNVKFILANSYLINSNDRFFNFCYHHPELIDVKYKEDIKCLIESVITKEYITEKIWKDNKPISIDPNWSEIYLTIRRKFGEYYASKLINAEKIEFYRKNKRWKIFTELMNIEIVRNPPRQGDIDYSWRLNDNAWIIFLKCYDSIFLEKALVWSNISIEKVGNNYPGVHNFYDTKANLLFKLGKTKEAIQNEQMAIEVSKSVKSDLLSAYLSTMHKMKKGIPTWK